MNEKNKKMIIGLVLIVLIVSGILLIKPKTKETEVVNTGRQSAPVAQILGSGSMVAMQMDSGNPVVGSEYNVKLLVEAGDKNVNGMQSTICYGPELEINDPMTDISGGENNEIIFAGKSVVDGKNCVDLAVGANLNAALTAGVSEMATIKFQTIAAGQGVIEILPEKTIVSGENPGSTTNKIEMSTIQNLEYTVTE